MKVRGLSEAFREFPRIDDAPEFSQPWYEADAKVAVAARREAIVVLPFDGPKSSGWIGVDSDAAFLEWREVVPSVAPGDPGTVSVVLDPRLLVEIAEALSASVLELTITVPASGGPMHEPMLVRPVSNSAESRVTGDAFAVVMPCRAIGVKAP